MEDETAAGPDSARRRAGKNPTPARIGSSNRSMSLHGAILTLQSKSPASCHPVPRSGSTRAGKIMLNTDLPIPFAFRGKERPFKRITDFGLNDIERPSASARNLTRRRRISTTPVLYFQMVGTGRFERRSLACAEYPSQANSFASAESGRRLGRSRPSANASPFP